MKHNILLLIICLTSNYVFAEAVDHTPAISQTELQYIDIKHYVQEQEINVLRLDDGEYLTLVKEETTGFPRGIAFIVPEINQPITHQPSIKTLYDRLTDYGWRSLLLTMPTIEQLNGPVNDISKTNNEAASNQAESSSISNTNPQSQANSELEKDSTDNSKTVNNPNLNLKAFHQSRIFSTEASDAIEQQILARVQSALEYAEQFPGYFIFVCQGKSCAWLTSLFEKQQILQPDALIMLSAHMPQNDLNNLFSVRVSKSEFPVLELFKQIDNQWVTTAIERRRKLARKHFKTDYRQRQLTSHIAFGNNHQRTVKEIYGFLSAVGM